MISVICPTYNEKEHLEKVLEFFTTAMPAEKELLIIDGGSTDGTVDIVKRWMQKHSNIKLLHNSNKYVPFALNIGIKASTGDPVIRLDAHTEYSKDYFEKILETFNKTGADIVGGPMRATGKTAFQKAVAYCTSTAFGIGGSKIHNKDYEGETDHVYLGAWKRNLFEDIGFFDERLKRNQDDEFSYRAGSYGKKIYLNPAIKSFYYPRSNISGLIKQYFQYGLFKPLVLKKVKSGISLRHLIPALFVLYLLTLPLVVISLVYLLPLLIYLIICFLYAIKNKIGLKEKLISLIVYPILHISYGSGFLIGVKRAF